MNFNFKTTYLNLPQIFFTENSPEVCLNPSLIIFNHSLAESLGLGKFEEQADVAPLCGKQLPEGTIPFSQAYAGHQFGYFNKLGDGRAHILGEHLTPVGDRFDFQLKGSGRTPYSRNGDGKAALGPMLREYLMSEAMFQLGIPTTRSLSVVKTGEWVHRERALPGAVLLRVASSHIRVGTFQYAAALGNIEDLKTFVNYVIQRHDPELIGSPEIYFEFLKKVIRRQAALVAQWMNVGFIHGVMNTDNMSIAGETIDYGPCAFIDSYNLDTVFSSIDHQGRYAFGKQPEMAYWNLCRFAETMIPLLADQQDAGIEVAKNALSEFEIEFHQKWQSGLRNKLGLGDEKNGDAELINRFLELLHEHQPDFTNTFCDLISHAEGTCLNSQSAFVVHVDFKNWLVDWDKRMRESTIESLSLMKASNPAVIPRNRLVEEALSAAVDLQDMGPFKKLLDVLSKPFDHSFADLKYKMPAGDGAAQYRTFCGT